MKKLQTLEVMEREVHEGDAYPGGGPEGYGIVTDVHTLKTSEIMVAELGGNGCPLSTHLGTKNHTFGTASI